MGNSISRVNYLKAPHLQLCFGYRPAGTRGHRDRTTIADSQQRATNRPSDSASDTDGLIRVNGKIWIPEKDNEMKLRILVAADCRCMGHRGATATVKVIAE